MTNADVHQGEIESHTEGILLFSETQTCYGKPLSTIIGDISDDIWGYGESITAEPHADGWSAIQIASDDPDANKHMLDNSAWIIDYDCFHNGGYKSELNLHSAGFFREGCIIVWADPTQHDTDGNDIEDNSRYPDKVSTVTSEDGLKRELTIYLDHGMNPKRGSGSKIQRWKQRVRERKKDLG